jgi:hypothetical protein
MARKAVYHTRVRELMQLAVSALFTMMVSASLTDFESGVCALHNYVIK